MSKFFILVASLMCISTLAACSGRATTQSDPTSICGVQLRPFDAACTEARFDVNKINHCNLVGFSSAHADFENCTALAEATPCLQNPFQEVCETVPGFDRIAFIRTQRWQNCTSLFPGFPPQITGIPCNFVVECGDNGNPFDDECLKFDDFNQNRTTRIDLCTERQGNVVSGCLALVGTQTIAQCIGTNPFHADCTHEAFNAARVARVAECSEASPDADLLCGSAIGADIGTDGGTETIANCITEPFHADCQNPAFNTSRVNRLIACGAADDPSGIECDAARERATTAAWLRSFGTDRLDTEPDTNNPRNQFLQGTQVVTVPSDEDDVQGDEGGLDVGEVRTISDVRPRVFSLNLATARYGEIPENGGLPPLLLADEEGESTGDISDGVAFFLGSAERDANAYAGILAGTDLGAPPKEKTGTAEWNGQFRVIGTYPVNKDFKLEIDFATRRVVAFVQVNEEEDPLHFSIDGGFGPTGVISGTVELGDYTDNVNAPANLLTNENRGTGQLTGLIGEEGAVGVFLKNPNDPGPSFNFAGGFVAAPTPDPEPTP